jgi:hypothetical protein
MKSFLTRDELRRLSGELAKLSPYHVKEFYRKALEDCRLERGIPQPKTLQELVTAWKLLRKWK